MVENIPSTTSEQEQQSKQDKQKQMETRLFKEWEKWLEKVDDKVNWEKITKKLDSVQKKLEAKFWDAWKEFFIRNMNDYLQAKYGARFDMLDNNWKKEMVLVLDKSYDKQKLEKLIWELKVNEQEVFIDENWDNKKSKEEKWVKITDNWMEVDEIFVSEEEIKSGKKVVGFWKIDNKEWNLTSDETLWWKVTFKDGKAYYEVWNHGDYIASPIRLFTALSNEYFWGMSGKELEKLISDLGVKEVNWKFVFYKTTNSKEKVWDFNSDKWTKIVQPHSTIDLTSLQKALDIKQMQVQKESKETQEWFTWWGRFYTWSKWEVWDIPDKWENITYDGYAKDYKWLKWNQISISAWNMYDADEKNNFFAEKNPIDLWDWKKWFLVIWEADKQIVNKLKNMKDPAKISSELKWKWVEAWFTTYEEWKDKKSKITIKEVWDPKVHVVTETSWSVDKWKDKSNPIVLDSNTYKFSWVIKWEIEFKIPENKSKAEQLKDKNWTDKLEIWIEKIKINGKEVQLKNLKEEQFNKIFPWWKWYLQLPNSHVVELSFDKQKWVQIKDLWEKKWTSFDVWWVSISQENADGVKFDKKTWKIDFPKQVWWGELDWKLKKWENKDFTFSLDKKIANYDIVVDWLNIKNVNELNKDITLALLYIWTSDVKKEWETIKYPEGVKVENWKIMIDFKKLEKQDSRQLLSKLDVNWKLSETFIMDGITENISKKYPKIEWKKESSQQTEQKTSKKGKTTKSK